MKKILSVLACSVLLFSIVACGSETASSESISLPNEAISHTESESSSTMQNSSKNENTYTTDTFEFVTLNDTTNPFVLSIGDEFGMLTLSSAENRSVDAEASDEITGQLANFSLDNEITLSGSLVNLGIFWGFKPDKDFENILPVFIQNFSVLGNPVDSFYFYTYQQSDELASLTSSVNVLTALDTPYNESDGNKPVKCTITISEYSASWSNVSGFGSFLEITSITA